MMEIDSGTRDDDRTETGSIQERADDFSKAPITPVRPLLPEEAVPPSGDENHVKAREMERRICRKVYRGVPVNEDFNQRRYLEVLQSYEAYMLSYESMAALWRGHYANVQQTIDRALGLASSGSNAGSEVITPEEREKLKQIGCIAIFGCGFNPTRELSSKLIKALADSTLEIVLVDFSRKSLRSSINFFLGIGIRPKAAYQMDLTMGTAAHLNSYSTNLRMEMEENPDGDDLDTYIGLIENEVDAIIEAYEKGEDIPGFFNNYPIAEDDRPGLSVSTMVTAATFLTIYEQLMKIVKKAEKSDEEAKPALIAKLRAIHAKFNAFVLRLNAAKMAELSRDSAQVLIITDVNKANLPLSTEAIAESIRAAIDALVSGEGVRDSSLVASVDNEIRMSRDGKREERLEDIIKSVPAISELTFESLGEEVPRQWMWWDDPGNESDDPGHGHKVQAVKYRLDKGTKATIIRLLEDLPDEVISSGDPAAAGAIVRSELARKIDTEKTKHGFKLQSCLKWFKEMEIPLDDVPRDICDRHRPYMHQGAIELIQIVPKREIECGWEQVLNYLQKEHNWQNDGITRGHVRTGIDWLRRFIDAIKVEERQEQ